MPEPSLFDNVPRVPRTDGSGRQIGVGIPPLKVAVSHGDALDEGSQLPYEAIARLNKRRKGEMPPIEGGIGDNDPALFIVPEDASPFEKMKVAQHGALTTAQIEMLKRRNVDRPPVENGGPARGPALPEAAPVTTPPSPPATPPALVAPAVPEPSGASERPRRRRAQPQERVVEVVKEVPVYRDVEKVVEKEVVRPGPFEKWAAGRVRVQIGLPDTTFNVSAVAVLRSVHGLTVILPTSNDAMTFVPRTGAHVSLAFRDETAETIFTGVSFEIEELSIMGLCFIRAKERATPSGEP